MYKFVWEQRTSFYIGLKINIYRKIFGVLLLITINLINGCSKESNPVTPTKSLGTESSYPGWTIYDYENIVPNGMTFMRNDNNGNIWFGVRNPVDYSFVSFDGRAKLNTYSLDGIGYKSNLITDFTFDSKNNLIIGTIDSGVIISNGTKRTIYNRNNSDLELDGVSVIAVDSKQNIWAGGNEGLAKFDGTKWQLFQKTPEGVPLSSIIKILPDKKGNICVESFDSVFFYSKYDGNTWKTYFIPASINVSFDAAALDSKGNLWLTGGNAIMKFEGSVCTKYNCTISGLSDEFFNSMAIDSHDNIWLGAYHGLVKFDGVNWKIYDKSNSGLPNTRSIHVTIDKNDNLWMFSGNKIVRFHDQEK